MEAWDNLAIRTAIALFATVRNYRRESHSQLWTGSWYHREEKKEEFFKDHCKDLV
jgi:hypothetical protein